METKCNLPTLSLARYQYNHKDIVLFHAPVIETKCALGLTRGDHPGNTDNIVVKGAANKVQIRENQRLLRFEATCDDVPRIVPGELLNFLQL